MPTIPRRSLAFVGVTVAFLVCAAAGYLVLGPRQSAEVAVPPADATPEQVVTAYLKSLDAHDCETAEAVMTDDARGIATGWCHEVAGLSDAHVGGHSLVPPKYSGREPGEQVADVAVTFDLDWRLFHNDPSLPEGTTTWGYELVRSTPDAPWRIFSEGTG